MTITDKTAILLFSRTAHEEAACKTFLPHHGKRKNIAVAQELINHTSHIIRQSGLPFFTCFSPQQSGINFGERLANAVASIYAAGFERVITIGNDSPFLTVDLLQNTAKQLESQPLILGPSTDGGVWLIGMQREAFQQEQFTILPWETDDLLTAWQDYASRLVGSIYLIQEATDIDTAKDLNHYLNSLSQQHSFFIKIQQLIANPSVRNFYENNFYPSTLHLPYAALRAPPCL